MENTCNYSNDWQDYIGDYDKFEYDILTESDDLVLNTYPNNGWFRSNTNIVHESNVKKIRFSLNPIMGINEL